MSKKNITGNLNLNFKGAESVLIFSVILFLISLFVKTFITMYFKDSDILSEKSIMGVSFKSLRNVCNWAIAIAVLLFAFSIFYLVTSNSKKRR